MRAIDTNVLVRIVTGDDFRESASADAFVERGAWVPIVALVAAVRVLGSVYELRSPALAAAIEMLLNHEHLTLQDADAITAALEVFRAKPGLGFSDCLILELARKAGHLPLGTFDGSLARIEGTQKL